MNNSTDPRRPNKIYRFQLPDPENNLNDQTLDYTNLLCMLFSVSGLFFEVRAEIPEYQVPAGSYNPINKRMLYVGGLAPEVSVALVRAAFIPFGDIIDINMPIDYESGKHRGFAFVEFEELEDATAAIDNMNESEILGRTVRVNVARPIRIREGYGRAVWTDDNWLKKYGSATMDQLPEVTSESVLDPHDAAHLNEETDEAANPIKRNQMVLPRVFLDLRVGSDDIGRIEIELRKDIVPKTAENFRALCTGERGYGYKGSVFHRVIPKFMCQGGDITNNDGSGGRSIYGRRFDDENFQLRHEGPGILSMANSGPNSNGSQFFITTIKCDWLDGKHVVFGRVVNGMEVVKKIEGFGSSNGKPSCSVLISHCGEFV
ncbi:hypothetical protein Ciccas_009605 [Cichlidogyrus casuarinus]|uniref:peptidylprolyl isomerase n=1 Tax=Cichlidogyrus casuarinus TaxID=1844966 RepID=A0ABD2PWK7_9PLAT